MSFTFSEDYMINRRLAEELFSSEEGLCSVELVI